MSLFYESLDRETAFAFKARKKKFKKGKPCAICGRIYNMDEMMVAHTKPVSELSDYDALYDTNNWEVRCIYCERKQNREKGRKNELGKD